MPPTYDGSVLKQIIVPDAPDLLAAVVADLRSNRKKKPRARGGTRLAGQMARFGFGARVKRAGQHHSASGKLFPVRG
jgi:hypothetical protein